ncbi:E3 ubiquitin-protein ligase RNF181, partial [Trifolium medium]|nr:E3 ubiquitin-protein ligase RNF181 [Trifolium medium]
EVVPAITRASEGEGYEVDYEESYGYEGYDGLEEDEEETIFEEEYIRFIPAAKSCIEELQMVEVEEVAKCVICFEDLNAG